MYWVCAGHTMAQPHDTPSRKAILNYSSIRRTFSAPGAASLAELQPRLKLCLGAALSGAMAASTAKTCRHRHGFLLNCLVCRRSRWTCVGERHASSLLPNVCQVELSDMPYMHNRAWWERPLFHCCMDTIRSSGRLVRCTSASSNSSSNHSSTTTTGSSRYYCYYR